MLFFYSFFISGEVSGIEMEQKNHKNDNNNNSHENNAQPPVKANHAKNGRDNAPINVEPFF